MNARDHEIDPDRELAGRFRVGDQEAFRQLHKLHGPAVFRFLQSRCSHREDAEELSQEVWQRAWVKREMFNDGHFRGWVFLMTRRLLIERQRRKSLVQMPEDVDVPASLVHDRSDELFALDGCLKSIEGDLVQTFRDFQSGVSTRELAANYGVAEGTVSSRISRAKKLLRDCVEEKLK